MLILLKRKKIVRRICAFLAISIFFEIASPTVALALTSGPAQEEFSSFEPSSTTDMVDLYTGDFNYNIPLMSVPGPNGGYPINLAYHSGIGMEQEASWVGLGWTLNVGAINRQLRGLPDDFNGEIIKKRQHMKDSWMVALDVPKKAYKEAFGFPTGGGGWNDHIQIYYNNYKGLGYKYSMKFAFPNKGTDENASIGLNVAFDSQNGMDVEPKLSLSAGFGKSGFGAGFDVGLSYNSRQGIQKFNFTTSLKYSKKASMTHSDKDALGFTRTNNTNLSFGGSSSSNVSYATNFNVPSVSIPMKTTTVPFNLKIAKPSDMTIPYNFKAKFPLLWSGYVTTTKLENQGKTQLNAYGYIHNNAQSSDAAMRDFHRDDIPYSKKVPNLPTSGFTYDLFSQTGQGTGGMFRSYQNQISVLRDPEAINQEESYDGELEFGVGNGTGLNVANMHVGLAFNYGSGQNRTGSWTQIKGNADEGSTITSLKSGSSSTNPFFERTYFKNYGEKSGFYSQSSSEDQLNAYGNDQALRLEIVKEKSDNNFLNRHFIVNDNLITTEGASATYNLGAMTEKNVTARTKRSSNIENFTNSEASLYGYSKGLTYKQGSNPAVNKFPTTRGNDNISEISMLQPDGMRYVYGLPSYNNIQIDNVFSYKNTGSSTPDFNTNTVPIPTSSSGIEGIDIKGTYEEFMSRNEMPAYPNSWLLTYIFSADYVDLTNNGPTNDDYGYWVKFNYEKIHDDYKWRAPYADASFIEGYKGAANKYDDKASYTYGEKEIFFLDNIETKTHTAKFITSDRRDGYEALSELAGGLGTKTLKKLDKIILYTKKELIANPMNPTPVKSVNFVYSYDLCVGVPNNKTSFATDVTNASYDENGNAVSATVNNNGGKLTLNQVYFTYQNSTRSQLSPYIFKYASGAGGNPNYERRNMDRWGNYNNNTLKYPTGNLYPYIDHPYTPQDPEFYTGATPIVPGQWSLNQIILPTGGTMNIDYDFDDYYYEEGEKACRMFDVVGTGGTNAATVRNASSTGPFNSEDHILYIKLEKPFIGMASQGDADTKLQNEYLNKLPKGQVYFKVFAEIKGKTALASTYDYVSGYADIDIANCEAVSSTSSSTYDYAKIALQKVPLSKVNVSGKLISPITRAIIEHLRVNRSEVLHNAVPYSTSPFAQIANILGSTISALGDLTSAVVGFNNWVYFNVYNKSFEIKLNGYSAIRLCDPDNKIGGGIRVKKLTLNDNWTNGTTTDNSLYGQTYDYTTIGPDGTSISSGVAYEPQVGSEESALRTAIKYTNSSLLTSDYHTFVETPIARIHYPGESVGYSKVTVKSIGAAEAKAATGNLINNSAAPITQYEFYTPKDFPVILKQTDMGPYSKPIFIPIPVLGLFTQAKRRQAKSQGYTVILNDMAGKPKANTIFTAKNTVVGSNVISTPDKVISRQKFTYNTVDPYNPNAKNELINKVQTINVDGSYNTVYRTAVIGQSHDIYVDMKENSQEHEAFGVMTNLDMAFFSVTPFCIPIPWIMPSYNTTTNNMRTVVFNKIIHRSGILMKTETTTDKSTIVSENLAFDIETGKTLLSKVTNEFKDPIYNFSFPGHWYYSNIGPAYKNFKLEFGSATSDATDGRIPITSAQSYFTKGDWVYIDAAGTSNDGMYHVFTLDNSYIHCVKSNGNYFPPGTAVSSINIVRSGYKNQQNVSVGSLAFMRFKDLPAVAGYQPEFVQFDPKNSATEFTSNQAVELDDPNENNILNASAVELSDDWQTACGISTTIIGPPTSTCAPSINRLNNWTTFLKNLATSSNLLTQNLVVATGPAVGTTSATGFPVTFSNGLTQNIYDNFPMLQMLINGNGPPYTSGGAQLYYSGFISPATKNLVITFNTALLPTVSDPNAICGAVIGLTGAPTIIYELPSSLVGTINTTALATTFWTTFLNSSVSAINSIAPPITGGGLAGCKDWSLTTSITGYGSYNIRMACRPWCLGINGSFASLNNIPCATCLDLIECTTTQGPITTNCGTNPNNATVVNPYQIGMKGIWRSKYSYAYKTDRKQIDNIRADGTFSAFNRFPWENPASKDPNWIKSNTVTKYNPEGFEIENVNPIGNFSSALYGYDNALSTAVANNARYNDIGFDGFEDYPKTCDQDHFSYSAFSANVTNAQAHTGKYSIEVFNGTPAHVSREVFVNCDANTVNGTPYVNDSPVPANLNTFGGNYVSHVIKPCDCIGKHAPQIGKRYLVSAWVKEYLTSNPNNLIADAYSSSRIHVTFFNGTTLIGNTYVYPQGNIIDGWQRLSGEYTMPSGCTSIAVDLEYFSSMPNTKVYFDDVRVQPTDANMKTFVYDNITLKVMAELDENNFATIYNYDEEGHLTKVKRETEEGIKTVQEGRINSKKVKN